MASPTQHLALMEATVALAMIYRKFTFRMASVPFPAFAFLHSLVLPYRHWAGPCGVSCRYGHVPQLTYRITNVCANGMKVFVFQRSQPGVAGLNT
jgi:hypothetical protein